MTTRRAANAYCHDHTIVGGSGSKLSFSPRLRRRACSHHHHADEMRGVYRERWFSRRCRRKNQIIFCCLVYNIHGRPTSPARSRWGTFSRAVVKPLRKALSGCLVAVLLRAVSRSAGPPRTDIWVWICSVWPSHERRGTRPRRIFFLLKSIRIFRWALAWLIAGKTFTWCCEQNLCERPTWLLFGCWVQVALH